MKKVFFVLVLFITLCSFSQVGIGNATPHVSAMLDLTASNKGFLPPRMTHEQKNAITAPTVGLLVWCTNCGVSGEMQIYNGTNWTNLIGAAATEPLILDRLNTVASAAYSLRQLRSAYTGACIRVRRSSDNTEQDIGFNSNGILNTTALLAFVGSGNGFVTTWYDQSGNNNNAIQSAAANQPRIVLSGVVDSVNGKPAIILDGNDWIPTSIILGRTAFPNATINTVFKYTNVSGSHALWGGDGGSWPRFQLLKFDSAPSIAYGLSNGTGPNVYSGLLSNTNQIIYSMISQVGTTNGTNIWINGTAGTPFSEGTNNASPSAITIGAIWPGGSYSVPVNSSFQEFFIFTTALSTVNKTILESSQGAYYGITIN